MKKKMQLLIPATIAILFAVYAFLSAYGSFQYIANNTVLDAESNRSIKTMVRRAVRAQYRRQQKDLLDTIFNQEFQQSEEFPGLFTRREVFYGFNHDFMQSIRFINDTELTLIVRVKGLVQDEYNQIIKMEKLPDGTYIISDIGLDP